jgi:ATP-binding cassette subfamily B protein
MTGEGKTTIISLLLRFYEFQKGSITINGRNIRDYTLDSLRKQFSLVLQEPVVFSGTVAENISLFNPEIDRQQIGQTLDYLDMRSHIEHFPNFVDYYLSERGKSLSVGEMQLLSMARAVAHSCSMFMLDEATANIDAVTEKVIQDDLKKILIQKTSLVIAHRLSTIQDVQRIFVLQAGAIVEQGSHAELLAASGVYEKLYRLQFA